MAQQTMSRRACLEGFAAAGLISSADPNRLGAVPLNSVDDSSGKSKRDSLAVGIITDANGSHLSAFLQGLAHCRGVEKVAIADPSGGNVERAQRTLGKRFDRSFRDYQEMLAKVQPGLTVITLEARHSPPAILAALETDSHVMTEKPSCVRLQDFAKVVKLAEKRKRHLMMALATRSSTAVKKARQIIKDGWLGKPYSTTMDWIADQTRLKSRQYQKSWLSFKDRAGGGKLIFHGIHYLDLIQFLMNDSIQQVSAFCENVGGQPIEVEDAAVLSFRFRSGMVGTLNTGYYLDRGNQNQVRVWGAEGWFHLDLPSRKPMQWHSTHQQAPRGVQEFKYTDAGGLYAIFLQEAVDAALGRAGPPITGRESLQALQVVFAAYRAAETGAAQKIGS